MKPDITNVARKREFSVAVDPAFDFWLLPGVFVWANDEGFGLSMIWLRWQFSVRRVEVSDRDDDYEC